MNKSYYEKDDTVYVFDENHQLRELENSENVEEILITENNIEELEEIVKCSKLERFNGHKDKILHVTMAVFMFVLSLTMPGFIISFAIRDNLSFVFSGFLSLFSFSFLGSFGLLFCHDAKSAIAQEKSYGIALEEFEKKLEEEKQKLENLRKNSKDKTSELTIPKILSTDAEIQILRNKLKVIEKYSLNPEEHIKHYKNNDMKVLMDSYEYTAGDIEFIKFLIEKELESKKLDSKEDEVSKTKRLGRK